MRNQWDYLENDRRWRRESKYFLANNWMQLPHLGLCAHCKHRAATCVDHIIPHRGDLALFWDVSNWQGMCRACHSIKTAREDGGFGNKPSMPQIPEFGNTGIRGTVTSLTPAEQGQLRKLLEERNNKRNSNS